MTTVGVKTATGARRTGTRGVRSKDRRRVQVEVGSTVKDDIRRAIGMLTVGTCLPVTQGAGVSGETGRGVEMFLVSPNETAKVEPVVVDRW